MKHAIGAMVIVTSLTDECANESYLNKYGEVMAHVGDGYVGNNEDDPLHRIKFEDGTWESFWHEELTELKVFTEKEGA